MKNVPDKKPVISPKTKLGELLEAWPHLEAVLAEMSPVFEKLKNPLLRKTVGRVATIQQISVVGDIPVEDIIKLLRSETGQDEEIYDREDLQVLQTEKPQWFNEEKIKASYDATPVINAGDSPMNEVLRKSNELKTGEILELSSSFIPAPILDLLQKKNFKTWSVKKGNVFLNYIIRS